MHGQQNIEIYEQKFRDAVLTFISINNSLCNYLE